MGQRKNFIRGIIVKEVLNIRSLSWGESSISWSVVVEELLYAAEQVGHEVVFLSTNGHKGMQYWSEDKSLEQEFWQRDFIRKHGDFDIDITYTVPQNFPQRFLKHSKCKMAIYAYESSIMPARWTQFYPLVDYMLPPSQYVADMMIRNGCPEEKVKIIPHGVDTGVFDPNIKPLNLKTEKKFKFLCVGEPHYRKQIDKLLDLYCKLFTNEDDVCFVLKTKIFKTEEELKEKKTHEMDLRPILANLKKKYGSKMPEIKVISTRLKNIASLYAACDAFVLMSASEGWGVPYLEALAMGLPVIAPRHGGQLHFLNNNNAFLTPCGIRKALPQEQYWGQHPKSLVGNPDEEKFGLAMKSLWVTMTDNPDRVRGMLGFNKKSIARKVEQGIKDAQQLTWKNAMQQIIDIANNHRK